MRMKPQQQQKTITTVVFDLDDTLYDCYRQRVLPAHRYACQKMIAAGFPAKLSCLLRMRLKLFHQNRNLKTLDRRLCTQFGLSGVRARRLAQVGRKAYLGYPLGQLRLFPETRPTLRRLHQRDVRLFIITAGRPALQRKKVRALGLDRCPYITRIFYAPIPSGQPGKQQELRRILLRPAGSRRSWELDPERILVVGDRPNREIQAANELGMISVRRLGGEFASYRPKSPREQACFTIRRLSEIFTLGLKFGPRN